MVKYENLREFVITKIFIIIWDLLKLNACITKKVCGWGMRHKQIVNQIHARRNEHICEKCYNCPRSPLLTVVQYRDSC